MSSGEKKPPKKPANGDKPAKKTKPNDDDGDFQDSEIKGTEIGTEEGGPTTQGDSATGTKGGRKGKTGAEKCKCGGCGKTYSSYPALYTHVKNKHDGIMPDGSVYSSSGNKAPNGGAKSGRPATFRQPVQKDQNEERLNGKFTFQNDLYVCLGQMGDRKGGGDEKKGAKQAQANQVYAEELNTDINDTTKEYFKGTYPGDSRIFPLIVQNQLKLPTLEELIREDKLDCEDEYGNLIDKVKKIPPQDQLPAFLGATVSWLSEKLRPAFFQRIVPFH